MTSKAIASNTRAIPKMVLGRPKQSHRGYAGRIVGAGLLSVL